MRKPRSSSSGEQLFYVSPRGSDRWSGTMARPNRQGNDGPWATPAGALAGLTALKQQGRLTGPVAVLFEDGIYALEAPLRIGPALNWPIRFCAAPGATPVFSGGRVIEGWKVGQWKGQPVWVTELPEVREGKWNFRSLFVNGQRAPRPRRPKNGLFRMAGAPGLKFPAGWGDGGQTVFECKPGDVQDFRNLTDVEVVYLHFWIEERSPLEAFDSGTNRVVMQRPSRAPLVGAFGTQLADYYLDNVWEELSEPGEWYLDRTEGRLYYLPRKGEKPSETKIIAPRLLQLLVLEGQPDRETWVEQIQFEGLVFAHTDWRHPSGDGATISGVSRLDHLSRGNRAAAGQAACDVPGVVALEGAHHCVFRNCVFRNLGWYGLSIGDGSHGVRVEGCLFEDLGAGGIKVDGASARRGQLESRMTGTIFLTDNTIHAGGRVFHSACGVLSMNAHRVTIAHNHIYDLYYTGISCGWEWGYQQNAAHSNTIAWNHIHDIGQGVLSDMGGIYTLGVQPGTVIRNNWIHNVRSAHYGGWCIYPDEGSSHLLIEGNVCYDADREPFHIHYGREILVLNNVFAFGGESVVRISRAESHVTATFLRNLFLAEGTPFFRWPGGSRPAAVIRSEANLFFDATGRRPFFQEGNGRAMSWKEWKRLGLDRFSLVADPKCQDLKKRGFKPRPGSPAERVGFVFPDLRNVGPRPPGMRGDVDDGKPARQGLRL